MKKKATREAGLIITNIAKLSLVKKRAKTESKQNSMRKEIIRDIKHHLNKFKSASR